MASKNGTHRYGKMLLVALCARCGNLLCTLYIFLEVYYRYIFSPSSHLLFEEHFALGLGGRCAVDSGDHGPSFPAFRYWEDLLGLQIWFSKGPWSMQLKR